MKKLYVYILVIFLVSIAIYCLFSHNNTDKELDVHKVFYERLYDYSLYNNDSLIFGLSNMGKEHITYKDGTTGYSIRMNIFGYDFDNEKSAYHSLLLNKDELKRLDVFLDSCIHGSLEEEEQWVMKVRDDIVFFYDEYDNALKIGFQPESVVPLRIQPKRLKEIINNAQKE